MLEWLGNRSIVGCMLSWQKLEVSDFTINQLQQATCTMCLYMYMYVAMMQHVACSIVQWPWPGVVRKCVTVVSVEYSLYTSLFWAVSLGPYMCMHVAWFVGRGSACTNSYYTPLFTHTYVLVISSSTNGYNNFEVLPRVLILFPNFNLWVFWLADFSQHQLFSLFSWFASISQSVSVSFSPSLSRSLFFSSLSSHLLSIDGGGGVEVGWSPGRLHVN